MKFHVRQRYLVPRLPDRLPALGGRLRDQPLRDNRRGIYAGLYSLGWFMDRINEDMPINSAKIIEDTILGKGEVWGPTPNYLHSNITWVL